MPLLNALRLIYVWIMKSFVWVIFFCISILTNSNAAILTKPFLYSITSPNGKVSHIFGTIHGGVHIQEIPVATMDKVKTARVLITEWAFTEFEVSEILAGRLIDLQVTKFEHKGQMLSPETRELLATQWKVDERLASKARSQDCSLISFGGPMSGGYLDIHFIHEARIRRIPVIPLDSPALFESIKSKKPQSPCSVENLVRSITPDRYWAYQNELLATYRAGDESNPDFAADDYFTSARNLAWLNTLIKELNSGNAFLAVGAAHLYGDKGLINLLTAKGFRFKRESF